MHSSPCYDLCPMRYWLVELPAKVVGALLKAYLVLGYVAVTVAFFMALLTVVAYLVGYPLEPPDRSPAPLASPSAATSQPR